MSFQTGFLVVLFVGAANKDATPEQRTRIKEEALPILRDTPDPRDAMATTVLKIAEIMGEEWRPEGEWDEAITNVLGWSA
jgi:hypothetical protein